MHATQRCHEPGCNTPAIRECETCHEQFCRRHTHIITTPNEGGSQGPVRLACIHCVPMEESWIDQLGDPV